MKNKPTVKRIVAYFIDMIIITVIASMFSNIKLLNPYLEKYNESSKNYYEFIETIDNTEKLLNNDELYNYSYDISYYGVYLTTITLILSIIYFVFFQCINGGKTIGKALFKIKVVTGEKVPKWYQFLLRSAIINSLAVSIVLLILIISVSKSKYENISNIIQFVDMGLIFVSVGMVLFREDGRGLHDILANTSVVSISNASSIKEAVVVENNKKTNTKKKSTATKKTTSTKEKTKKRKVNNK